MICISALRAEFITFKQTTETIKNDRNSQIGELKETVQQVGTLVQEVQQSIISDLRCILNNLSRIETVVLNNITQMKNDIKLLKQELKGCEESMNLLQNKVEHEISKTSKNIARSKGNPSPRSAKADDRRSAEANNSHANQRLSLQMSLVIARANLVLLKVFRTSLVVLTQLCIQEMLNARTLVEKVEILGAIPAAIALLQWPTTKQQMRSNFLP